ncbi:Lipopolysaccharide core heptosyltransferase I [hydrothermal vent metagenome]|uniref:Lipopolysaccharide heptosyltransferase 1 n=1 Tax=hydrothermal vent metagenome TaxID=652676 RepID=A0A3B1DEE6_9ZZZZ
MNIDTNMTAPQKKFLFIRVSSLGDVLHALPALATLRANHPTAYIAWLVEAPYRGLLYNNPDLDEIIVIRTRYWRKNWTLKTLGEIRDTIALLRKHQFDVALDLQGLIKTGLIALLSGASLRLGLNRKNCREPLNTLFSHKRAGFVGKGSHVVDISLNLVRLAGGTAPTPDPHPLTVPQNIQEKVDVFFKDNPDLKAKPIAAINPGAGFPTKLWELDRFAKLADRIASEQGLHILLAWGPGEKPMAEQIASAMTEKSWIAPKTSIQESIALFRHIALMISSDSGPLHLCAGMGIPTVSIFGPTDPVRNGAYGPNHQVVYKEQPCSFCWKKTCAIVTHDCMQKIAVEDVLQAVKTSISKFVNMTTSR